MEKELGPVLSAALSIIEEIDRAKLPPNVLHEVNEVEAQIVKSLPIISTHSNSAHLRKVSAGQTAHRGPVFSQETGGEVSSSSRSSHLPSDAGTSSTTSSLPQADNPVQKKGRRPKKGGYACHICGKLRDRKSDLDGHLWMVHRVGQPIQCNIHPCK